MIITFDAINKIAKVYQDGELIGETKEFRKLFPYNKQEFYYIGVGDPNREEIPNFFKGYVNSFAHWNTLLSEHEIKRISSLDYKLLTD